MKKIIFITLCALIFTTCDKVKVPNPYGNVHCPLDTTTRNCLIQTNANNNNTKKVLLEDYTGHTCGNCPNAARIAESLEKTYGDKLIILANHVSTTFAKPVLDTMYKEDFRNSTGNDWDVAFGLSSAGLPKGMVNRTTPFAQNAGNWSALVSAAASQAQTAKLDVTSIYDTIQKLIKVKVKTTFLKAFSSEVWMLAVLSQDSLVGDQRDYSPPAGVKLIGEDRRPDYRFENVLIRSINGSTGQLVKSNPALNDTVTVNTDCFDIKSIACFFTPPANPKAPNEVSVCINDKYINLVVFVYDNESKEVLQVEKLRIKGSASTHN